MIEQLTRLVFTGVPGNAAYDLLKALWTRCSERSLSELYIRGFESALKSYAKVHPETRSTSLKLNKKALVAALAEQTEPRFPAHLLAEDAPTVRGLAAEFRHRGVVRVSGGDLEAEAYEEILNDVVRSARDEFVQQIAHQQTVYRETMVEFAARNLDVAEDARRYLEEHFLVQHQKFDELLAGQRFQDAQLAAVHASLNQLLELQGAVDPTSPRSGFFQELRLVSIAAITVERHDATSDIGGPGSDSTEDYLLDEAARIVREFGGQVVDTLANLLVSVFGLPTPQEDDAERAVSSMLEVVSTISPMAVSRGLAPMVRTGIAFGEMLTADGLPDHGSTAKLVKEAIGLARRAQPGEILVDAPTVDLASRAVAFRRVQRASLFPPNLQAWKATAVRERRLYQWELEGKRSRLVGRSAQLGEIERAWGQAVQNRGSRIGICGEVGVGKSRLAMQAMKSIAKGRGLAYAHARAQSTPGAQRSQVLRDVIRGMCSSFAPRPLDLNRMDVHATIKPMLQDWDPDAAAAALQLVSDLFSDRTHRPAIFESPKVNRQLLTEAIRTLIVSTATRLPLLLVLDDLQWIDEVSESVLQNAVDAVDDKRILAVLIARGEKGAVLQGWQYDALINLLPLDKHHSGTLIRSVARVRGAPQVRIDEIFERTKGNPFFIEQLVADLASPRARVGAEEVNFARVERLPVSLGDVLQAKIGQLTGEARSLLQVASVIGQSFELALLQRVSSVEWPALWATLHEVEAAQIVTASAYSNWVFEFGHELVRKAAYASVPDKQRLVLHRGIARALEEVANANQFAEVIAMHYAATEERTAAIKWYEAAGDRARSDFANQTARTYYSRALELVKTFAPDTSHVAVLTDKLARSLKMIGDHEGALEAFEAAVSVFDSIGDHDRAASAVSEMGMLYARANAIPEGIVRVKAAIARLGSNLHRLEAARLHLTLASLEGMFGSYPEAEAASLLAASLARLGDSNEARRVLAKAEIQRGIVLGKRGERVESVAVHEAALALVKATGDIETEAVALSNVASAHGTLGHLRKARQYHEQALALSQKTGDRFQAVWDMTQLGVDHTQLGDWQKAESYLDRAHALSTDLGLSWCSPYPLIYLGELAFLRGRMADAEKLGNEALTQTSELQSYTNAQTLLVKVDLALGRTRAAEERMADLAQRHDAEIFRQVLDLKSLVHLANGEVDQANHASDSCVAYLREHEQISELVQALRIRGQVLRASNNLTGATGCFSESKRIAAKIPQPHDVALALREWAVTVLSPEYRCQVVDDESSGPMAEGLRLLQSARTVFAKLSDEADVELTDALITELS
jgi:adenylate cyclase